MDTPKRAVFSTANDAYVPKAVVSLLTFMRFNPEFDSFILCGRLSESNRALCSYCGVTPIELDLSAAFPQEWRYPRECFHHFKAPSLFLSKGYDYSVYVDGDTCCNGKFDLAVDDFHIAGASYDTIAAFFRSLGEYDQLRAHFAAPEDGFAWPRIQSGVLVYNNALLTDADYFGKAQSLYDLSIKRGVPRKGDDSLLALTLAIHPELRAKVLPQSYNLIDFKIPDPPKRSADSIVARCVVYHFVKEKPWSPDLTSRSYSHRFFVDKWREVMINHFTQRDIERCFPAQYKPSITRPEDINFYWYTSDEPNFGDSITPYLVAKVCGRKIDRPVNPLKTSDPVIISTGSIMRMCGANTIVWGSGIRTLDQDIKPGGLIRSTRGPLTRKRILDGGGECPPIYGDPALLLPRLFDPRPVMKRYSLGITPHISQYEQVRKLYADKDGVSVIDLRTTDVEMVVTRIAECEAIASSSLHGIITANAYRVPVRWVRFDKNIFGDDTKFYDHFAAIGRPSEMFIDAVPYRKIPVEAILEQIHPYEVVIDLDKLWDAGVFHRGEISKYMQYLVSDAAGLANNDWSRRDPVCEEILSLIPKDDAFILVDEDQIRASLEVGVRSLPFVEHDGEYWGPPSDDQSAIQEFNRLWRQGARFLVVTAPAFWWLDYYAGWNRHLRGSFPCLFENERLVVFDLRSQPRTILSNRKKFP